MTVLDDTALDLPLSAAMRQRTLDEHQAAEDSDFMSSLMKGLVNERGYIDYLLRLRPVYAVMEEVVREHRDDPAVAAVYDADLERLATIDADLDHWAPGVERTVDSPAADAYCARVREAAAEWSPYLVAHHYTRYLGDLSGGQVVASVLQRHLGVRGPEGLEFYHFDIGPLPHYKRSYRDKLDSMCADQTEEDGVVDEARRAFALNIALFDSLETR